MWEIVNICSGMELRLREYHANRLDYVVIEMDYG
jgi:hypothetical protein